MLNDDGLAQIVYDISEKDPSKIRNENNYREFLTNTKYRELT